MDIFLNFYQHIPLYLNPTLKVGLFSVSYYSLMYILAFAVVYFLLIYRIRKRETDIFSKSSLVDFLLYSFAGLLIGARLGEVIFYNFSYYWQNPLAVISPFDPATHEFIGIYGMSYHGGLIGVVIASYFFIRKYKVNRVKYPAKRHAASPLFHEVNFWSLSNFVVPAIPAGYFFGRVGNFINNELYGRVTAKPWGMYFKDYPYELRHPSQLYEAFLEGIVLFMILWILRNKKQFQGHFLALYLIGYGFFRFICEFFREPDVSSAFMLKYITLGQWFSLIMIIAGIIIALRRKNCYN
jgi:phosphatidylglycerol---prolipoprotein diacylglyceryl transferase